MTSFVMEHVVELLNRGSHQYSKKYLCFLWWPLFLHETCPSSSSMILYNIVIHLSLVYLCVKSHTRVCIKDFLCWHRDVIFTSGLCVNTVLSDASVNFLSSSRSIHLYRWDLRISNTLYFGVRLIALIASNVLEGDNRRIVEEVHKYWKINECIDVIKYISELQSIA